MLRFKQGVGLGLFLIISFHLTPIQGQHKIVFDTDFVIPPQDDALALLLALNSPELEILGITTVAGNSSLERANSDVLWVLERLGRVEIPVYSGANMPLLHGKSDFATQGYGDWWSDDPPPAPPGGFAKKSVESVSAVQFILDAVRANPGQITIVAIGPLTNIAMAIRLDPAFASNVKKIFIMGGAIAALPDGSGNQTPNAEYNFWVDPEAARIVLRSGIPVELSPLNVSRKTAFSKEWYDRIVAVETPTTRLIRLTMEGYFRDQPNRVSLMYDQVAVASLIDPSLVTTQEMYVDVDTFPGINYGVSVGGRTIWPGAEQAQLVRVQYDLDWDRFIEFYVTRVTREPSGAQ